MTTDIRPNPLEERSRYPHESKPRAEPPPTPPNPEGVAPIKVDPASHGPVDETAESDWEGQEGVGPGPREAVRRQERGARSPERPPADDPDADGV
jgi:hypothetical protein